MGGHSGPPFLEVAIFSRGKQYKMAKLFVALSLVGSASAFVAPSAGAPASSALKADAQGMDGILAPVGFFDPLGLSKDIDEQRLQFYREAEIKHGRVAMLASVGFLFQEHFHFESGPFAGIDSPSFVSFEQPPLAGGLWFYLALGAGNLEYLSVNTFEELLPGGIVAEKNEAKLFRIKADHEAGDLGFDPLGLKPTDAQELKNMQTKEIQNGRLAMLGIAGMVAQELVTHAKI